MKGVEHEETYSPVICYNAIRYFLSLFVKYELHIYQMDAVTAFLQEDLKEDIHVSARRFQKSSM